MPEQVEENASRFTALGNPIRLAIVRLLVQGHEHGTPAGVIQRDMEVYAAGLAGALLKDDYLAATCGGISSL